VQDKEYRIKVLGREAGYLLGVTEHGLGKAAVLLSVITFHWMRLHFSDFAKTLDPPDNLSEWLDRHVGRPNLT
jgi:hypothetical protein